MWSGAVSQQDISRWLMQTHQNARVDTNIETRLWFVVTRIIVIAIVIVVAVLGQDFV